MRGERDEARIVVDRGQYFSAPFLLDFVELALKRCQQPKRRRRARGEGALGKDEGALELLDGTLWTLQGALELLEGALWTLQGAPEPVDGARWTLQGAPEPMKQSHLCNPRWASCW